MIKLRNTLTAIAAVVLLVAITGTCYYFVNMKPGTGLIWIYAGLIITGILIAICHNIETKINRDQYGPAIKATRKKGHTRPY